MRAVNINLVRIDLIPPIPTNTGIEICLFRTAPHDINVRLDLSPYSSTGNDIYQVKRELNRVGAILRYLNSA